METIYQIFPYAIAYTIPLLITALGGLFSERSGIVNIGLEGLMVVGAFTCAMITYLLQPLFPETPVLAVYIGLIGSMIISALFSLLHAFASINLKANQVISGTAINMMASAITVFVTRQILKTGNITINSGIPRGDVPLLSKIPVLGKLFFSNTYATTWIILAILGFSTFLLYKTAFGLRLRACGEHPHAADAAGINVYKMRYMGVLFSGAFAGLGGAVIIVTISGQFTGSVAGIGFLALASLIFGQWKPWGILGATFFFGFARTISNVAPAYESLKIIPIVFFKVFPYVITLVALILFSRKSQAPKAVGEPFDHGKR